MMSEYNQTIGFFFVNECRCVEFDTKSNIDGVFAKTVEYGDVLRIYFDCDGRIDHVIYGGEWHSICEYDVFNHNISMILRKWDSDTKYCLNLHPNHDDNALSLCYEEVGE